MPSLAKPQNLAVIRYQPRLLSSVSDPKWDIYHHRSWCYGVIRSHEQRLELQRQELLGAHRWLFFTRKQKRTLKIDATKQQIDGVPIRELIVKISAYINPRRRRGNRWQHWWSERRQSREAERAYRLLNYYQGRVALAELRCVARTENYQGFEAKRVNLIRILSRQRAPQRVRYVFGNRSLRKRMRYYPILPKRTPEALKRVYLTEFRDALQSAMRYYLKALKDFGQDPELLKLQWSKQLADLHKGYLQRIPASCVNLDISSQLEKEINNVQAQLLPRFEKALSCHSDRLRLEAYQDTYLRCVKRIQSLSKDSNAAKYEAVYLVGRHELQEHFLADLLSRGIVDRPWFEERMAQDYRYYQQMLYTHYCEKVHYFPSSRTTTITAPTLPSTGSAFELMEAVLFNFLQKEVQRYKTHCFTPSRTSKPSCLVGCANFYSQWLSLYPAAKNERLVKVGAQITVLSDWQSVIDEFHCVLVKEVNDFRQFECLNTRQNQRMLNNAQTALRASYHDLIEKIQKHYGANRTGMPEQARTLVIAFVTDMFAHAIHSLTQKYEANYRQFLELEKHQEVNKASPPEFDLEYNEALYAHALMCLDVKLAAMEGAICISKVVADYGALPLSEALQAIQKDGRVIEAYNTFQVHYRRAARILHPDKWGSVGLTPSQAQAYRDNWDRLCNFKAMLDSYCGNLADTMMTDAQGQQRKVSQLEKLVVAYQQNDLEDYRCHQRVLISELEYFQNQKSVVHDMLNNVLPEIKEERRQKEKERRQRLESNQRAAELEKRLQALERELAAARAAGYPASSSPQSAAPNQALFRPSAAGKGGSEDKTHSSNVQLGASE